MKFDLVSKIDLTWQEKEDAWIIYTVCNKLVLIGSVYQVLICLKVSSLLNYGTFFGVVKVNMFMSEPGGTRNNPKKSKNYKIDTVFHLIEF